MLDVSPEMRADILRRVAESAVADARAAWKKARATPTEHVVREAFQLCGFAARALKNLAAATPEDSSKVIEAAGRIDVVTDDLKDQLVRIIEDQPTAPRE